MEANEKVHEPGELDFIILPQTEPDLHALRATPWKLTYLTSVADRKLMRWDDITFDEQETLDAFERIGASGEPFELVIRGDDAGGWDHVSVRRGSTVIELPNIVMR